MSAIITSKIKNNMSEKLRVQWHNVAAAEHGLYSVNYIGFYNEQFYCHLCKKKLLTWLMVFSHIKNRQHNELKNLRINHELLKSLKLPASLYREMVMNGIFMNAPKFSECTLCDRKPMYSNVSEHIQGVRHQSQKQIFIDKVMLKEDKSVNTVTKKVHDPVSNNSSHQTATVQNPLRVASVPRQFQSIIYPSHDDLEDVNTLCHICYTPIKNRVLLHIHLTWHFWPRFETTSPMGINLNPPSLDFMSALFNRYSNGKTSNNSVAPLALKAEDFPPLLNTVQRNKIIKNSNEQHNVNSLVTENNTPTTTMVNNLQFPSILTNLTRKNEKKIEKPPSVIVNQGMSVLQRLENMSKQLAEMENINEDKPVSEPQIPIIRQSKKNDQLIDNIDNIPKKITRLENQITPPDIDSDGLNFIKIYNMDNKQLENIKLSVILSCIRNKKKNTYCLICQDSYSNTPQSVLEHCRSINHCKYLKQIQQDHEKFATFPEQLSDLALAMQFMHETCDDFVRCFVCNDSIANDIVILKEHMNSARHEMQSKTNLLKLEKVFKSLGPLLTRNWYNVQKYWCVPCDIKMRTEIYYLKHLHSRSHEKNCNKFNRYEELINDFCASCATLWYGFRSTFAYHCECKMHKYHAQDNFFIITELPKAAKYLLVRPEIEIDKIIMEIKANADYEKLKEAHLLKDLEKTTIEKYEHVKLHTFGSRVSGLGLSNSDIDIFVDCNNNYYSTNGIFSDHYYLKEIELCLTQENNTWTINRTVLNCRVPIVRVQHKPTGLECDISFSNGLSVESTKLIKAYNDKFPLCQKLIVFVKQWIKACELTGLRGISSCAVAWLVIYYLQTKCILPSVGDLIELEEKSKFVGDWETGAKTDFELSLKKKYKFNELLKEFFIFYDQFDYRHEVVCPLMGSPVQKLSFQVPTYLPVNMDPYKIYVKTATDSELFRIDSPMCLQDPFELSNNITKSVTKFTVYKFKKFCLLSSLML